MTVACSTVDQSKSSNISKDIKTKLKHFTTIFSSETKASSGLVHMEQSLFKLARIAFDDMFYSLFSFYFLSKIWVFNLLMFFPQKVPSSNKGRLCLLQKVDKQNKTVASMTCISSPMGSNIASFSKFQKPLCTCVMFACS